MLFIQSYGYLSIADMGFARENLMVAEVAPASNGYAPDRARRYIDMLTARVRALPGVVDVAFADRVPFFIGFDRQTMVWPAGKSCDPETCPKYATYAVSPGYFRTMARTLDSNVAVSNVKTMEQRMAVQLWPFRTLSWMFSICGALAVVLATVGLAGVVIHAVSRRTREFGVRLSVGATPRDLAAEVLKSSAVLLIPGLAAGLLFTAVAARLTQVVNVLNPAVYLGVAAMQCVVMAVACLGPAIRAARIDPLLALRAD